MEPITLVESQYLVYKHVSFTRYVLYTVFGQSIRLYTVFGQSIRITQGLIETRCLLEFFLLQLNYFTFSGGTLGGSRKKITHPPPSVQKNTCPDSNPNPGFVFFFFFDRVVGNKLSSKVKTTPVG